MSVRTTERKTTSSARARAIAGTAVVALLASLAVGCSSDDDAGTSAGTTGRIDTTVATSATTATTSTTATTTAAITTTTTITTSTTTLPPSTPPSTSVARPAEPAAYARVAFDAWRTGDRVRLRGLATEAAYAVLVARPATASDTWPPEPHCEGAAGSTYCEWTSATQSLVLRIGNEAAATGQVALMEARFTAT